MVDKYLRNNAGHPQETIATVASTGVAQAGTILALDASGRLDPSVLPPGVGASTVSVTASENLAAGDFVNLYNNAGTLNVRKADATTNGKPAHGFVLTSVISAATALVYLGGINTALSGMTPGTLHFLATTAGLKTATAPSATGNFVQQLGVSIDAVTMRFIPQEIATVA